MQILFVGMPGVVFVVFALHKTSSQSAKNGELEEVRNQRNGIDVSVLNVYTCV